LTILSIFKINSWWKSMFLTINNHEEQQTVQ
jgi:hypothetical protein